jgi:hypothetical protein
VHAAVRPMPDQPSEASQIWSGTPRVDFTVDGQAYYLHHLYRDGSGELVWVMQAGKDHDILTVAMPDSSRAYSDDEVIEHVKATLAGHGPWGDDADADQPPYPHLPYPERLAAVWAEAAAAGMSATLFLDTIQEAVARAIRYKLHSRLGWMLSSDDPDIRQRLGYTAFDYGNDLYAVRMADTVGDNVRYSVFRLGDQASDDVEVVQLTVDGKHDPGAVQARARDAIRRLTIGVPEHIEVIDVADSDGYACFRHHDGDIYEIRKVDFSGPNLMCTVSRLGEHPQEVATFEAKPPRMGQEDVLAQAYTEVTVADLFARWPATTFSGTLVPDGQLRLVPDSTETDDQEGTR